MLTSEISNEHARRERGSLATTPAPFSTSVVPRTGSIPMPRSDGPATPHGGQLAAVADRGQDGGSVSDADVLGFACEGLSEEWSWASLRREGVGIMLAISHAHMGETDEPPLRRECAAIKLVFGVASIADARGRRRRWAAR